MPDPSAERGAMANRATSRGATPEQVGARVFGARLRDILIRRAMVILMLIVILAFGLSNDTFFTLGNLQAVLIAAAPFALIAIGQTLVILTGGIDLSVGSVIALSSMVAALVVKGHPELVWLAPLVGIGAGFITGSIAGVLVARDLVPPFIATLALLTAASGAAYVVGQGSPISGLPAEYGLLANYHILGLRPPVLLMIVSLVVFSIIMASTTFGLRVYAVGGNPVASRIAGVHNAPILYSVYAISGMLAGLSGVLLSSRVVSGLPNLGEGYELDAIAAVVIGGASLFGGRGTILGTALGLLLIQTLNNGLDILVVPSYWQSIIKGTLIVLAVSTDVWALRRTETY
jgi:ribose transport system permease protein